MWRQKRPQARRYIEPGALDHLATLTLHANLLSTCMWFTRPQAVGTAGQAAQRRLGPGLRCAGPPAYSPSGRCRTELGGGTRNWLGNPRGQCPPAGARPRKGRDLATKAAAHGDLRLSSRWTLTAREVVSTGTAEGTQFLWRPSRTSPVRCRVPCALASLLPAPPAPRLVGPARRSSHAEAPTSAEETRVQSAVRLRALWTETADSRAQGYGRLAASRERPDKIPGQRAPGTRKIRCKGQQGTQLGRSDSLHTALSRERRELS